MPFLIIRNDITKVKADAVVNPSNIKLTEGRGTSRAIFLSAGERKLARACRKIEKCKVGESVITDAFDMPLARYIIHAAGPAWQGGEYGEERTLYHTYQSALKLALKNRCESVAFPLLSSGNYGFPKDKAVKIAVSAFSDFLLKHDMLIYLVLYDRNSFSVGQKIFSAIEEYIDDHYVEDHDEVLSGKKENLNRFYDQNNADRSVLMEEDSDSYTVTAKLPTEEVKSQRAAMPMMAAPAASMPVPNRDHKRISKSEKTKRSLDDLIKNMDETFSQMLLRLIDERGLKDSAVYKKANIDRRHFSKIRNNINYFPTKRTVFSFAIALELSLDETKDLMNKAGYSLSRSSKFDVIISYFLDNGIYDIFEINEILFAYEQPVLGE